jgi:hypothetical protein
MKGKNVSRLFNNAVPTEKVTTWHQMRQESHYERRACKDLNRCDHALLKALSCYPMSHKTLPADTHKQQYVWCMNLWSITAAAV